MFETLEKKLERLKKCPFCGNSAEVLETGSTSATVRCRNMSCGAVLNPTFSGDMDSSKSLAVDLWNRRSGGKKDDQR